MLLKDRLRRSLAPPLNASPKASDMHRLPAPTHLLDLERRLIITSLSALFMIVASGLSVHLALGQTPSEGRFRQRPPALSPQEASGDNLCYRPNEVELKAKATFYNNGYNKARTLAERALRERPRAILGALVLSQVYEVSEGNYPKALYWVRRAQDWLILKCDLPPKDPSNQRLHKDLIIHEAMLLGDMDDRARQLKALKRYDIYYNPPRDDLKIWPLVKLGRFDEARTLGLKLIQHENSYIRSRAFNGLMAVECEARNRRASYEWGMKGHIDSKEQSCVISLNMGLASRQIFEFDDEERFNRIAINAQDRDCSSSPYIQSSATYLIRGEFQKSISALTSWAPKTASEFMKSHMRVKARRAELMYSLGVWSRGLEEIHQVVTYPDRSAGTDSASEELLLLEASLLYWAMLDGVAIATREHQTIRGGWAQVQGVGERAHLAFRRWKQRRQIIRYATYNHLLIDLIRPYFSNVMPWYLNAVTSILGEGVLRVAIRRVRALEAKDFPKVAGAYLDALESELSWRSNEDEEALRLAERALDGIPKEAKLIRYRMRALRWAIKGALQGSATLDEDLHILLQHYPTPLRVLGLSVPAQIKIVGGALAESAARALSRSPRLSVRSDAKLTFEVSQTETLLKICLFGPTGYRYGCVQTLLDYDKEVELRELKRRSLKGNAHVIERTKVKTVNQAGEQVETTEEADDREALELDPALRVVDYAHAQLFSPKVELSQKELDTLDGNILQITAEDALESLY